MGFAAIGCLALVAALGTVPAAADLISRPSVEGESVSNITPTDATLEAQINSEGLETTYEVWVGTVSCVEFGGPADTCESTSPGQIVGTIPAGGSTQTISVDAAKAWRKLAPNSSYVFSVSAANSAGKTSSDFKVFKTAAGAQPTIVSESVSNITPTDATLEAQINSEGLETTYEFHMVGAYCEWPCESPEYLFTLPAGKLLGSFVGQNVSLDLNSAGVNLMPINTYWVTATNADGTTEGPSHTFRSGEGGVQPLNTATPSRTTGNSQGTSSTPTGSRGSPTPGVAPLGPQIVCLCNCARGCHGKKVSPGHLTRTQKRSKALKACAKKPKRERAACEKLAHKRYGPKSKKK